MRKESAKAAAARLTKSLQEDGATCTITRDGEVLATLGMRDGLVAMTDGKQDDFKLEPTVEPGHVPERVIDELREAYRIAKDYATAYSEAAKAQAEKYRVAPGALKRYIAAIEGDKLAEAEKEAEDLARLIAG